MATNPADILRDPDFQGLNLVEKGKVLAHIDPDYAGLPQMEQQKFLARITSGGAKPAQPQPGMPQPPKWATQQGVFGKYGPDVYGTVGAGWEAAKPAIEIGAAAAGAAPGLATIPVNPLLGGATALAGGGAGYATAKQGTRLVDKLLGAPSDMSPAPLTKLAGGGKLPQTAQDILSGAENTAEGEVIPRVAKAGLDWIGSQTKKMPARVINSLIKPLKKDFAYGKNPGRVVADEGIVANNFEDLADQISAKRDEIGNRLNSVAGILDKEATNKGITVDITDSLKPIDEALAKAEEFPESNESLIKRLNALKRDLLGVQESTSPKGIEISTRKLTGLSFQETLDIKRGIGDVTKWTGNASDDKAVNMALKKVWGNIKGDLNEKAVEINPDLASSFQKLNEKYADITSADIAVKYRDVINKRLNIMPLAGKLTAAGGIITGIATGNPLPALAGLSGAGLEKALGSTAFKTRLAAWLAKMTPEETNITMKEAQPAIIGMIEKMFPRATVTAIQSTAIKESDKARFIENLIKKEKP